MFFTSISKLFSSWYLPGASQWNVGCINTHPPALGVGCAVLAFLTGISLSLQLLLISLLLVVSSSPWMPFSSFLFLCISSEMFTLRLPYVSLPSFFHLLYLPVCLILDFFPSWHHVMLFVLMDDNNTGSFKLFYLVYMSSMKINLTKYGQLS